MKFFDTLDIPADWRKLIGSPHWWGASKDPSTTTQTVSGNTGDSIEPLSPSFPLELAGSHARPTAFPAGARELFSRGQARRGADSTKGKSQDQ